MARVRVSVALPRCIPGDSRYDTYLEAGIMFIYKGGSMERRGQKTVMMTTRTLIGTMKTR